MKTKLEKLNTCMRVSIDKGYYGDVIILANQAKRIKESKMRNKILCGILAIIAVLKHHTV